MTVRSTDESGPRLAPSEIVERLVAAATRVLADEGPSQIKARSVAEAAGVSTTAMYYHVGGIPELLQAVADSGFRDLDRVFAELITHGDPVADLFTMALAARDVAQGNPHLYDLMFGLSARGSYRPPGLRTSSRIADRSVIFQSVYSRLVEACSRLLESGRIRPEDPEIVAAQLWSCVHGFVGLELRGQFSSSPDPVRQILLPMTANIIVALGDNRERAYASEASALSRP